MQVVDPPLVKTLQHPIGGLTSLSSGTASFDARQWLHQLGAAGLTPHDLVEMVRAVEAAAREEEEELTAAMPAYRKKTTGVDNTIFISVKFPRHVPRIKVAIDPPTHLDRFGKNAVVAIADGSVLEGESDLPSKIRRQVEYFTELNRATLLDYWEQRIDDDELRERLLANKDRVEAGRPR
jgi:hypothetical protein